MRTPLFERLAEHVERLVVSGSLKPGERVPSVRSLARQFEVSTNTVLQAFSRLEARGIVEARPRSGIFVTTALSPMRESTTKTRVAVPRPLRDRLPGFFDSMSDPVGTDFGSAAPAVELLPTRKLGAALARVARARDPRLFRYDGVLGHLPLRRQLARRLARIGCEVAPDDVVVTHGAIDALHLSLRACTSPGDAVAVESPCYFGVLQLLGALGLRAVEVPSDPIRGLTPRALSNAAALRPLRACVVVPNFSNPTGALMPAPSKRELVEWCATHDVALIESDVYGELQREGPRPLPLKAFDATGNVLHCSSFSKTVAPGWRVGWVVPGRWKERVEELQFTTSVATPVVTQASLAELLTSGGLDRHLRELRTRVAEQVDVGVELVRTSFPGGTEVVVPQGGYLLWLKLPKDAPDALTVQRRALEAHLNLAPGPLFSTGSGFDRHLRLSFGHPWTRSRIAALTRLGSLAS